MRTKADTVEQEMYHKGRGVGSTEGTLFGSPAAVKPEPVYTAAERKRDIERLTPLARELASRAGPDGITVSNLRFAAVRRGLLTGYEQGRRLSFLGAVMKAAGLVKTGEYRRSDVQQAHGNLNAIWRVK